jgi:uncharacterized membrane protein YcaP (DUF421 family)
MDSVEFFSAGWANVARVVVIGVVGYLALFLLLRGAGKRTMARMNTFDFVITVTIGGAFGRVLTATEVGIVEAIVAFAVLISMQYIVSSLRLRSSVVASLVQASPSLLYFRGGFLRQEMRRERVAESDLYAVIRQNGLGSFSEVEAIVLESDGQYAVVRSPWAGDGSALPQPGEPR